MYYQKLSLTSFHFKGYYYSKSLKSKYMKVRYVTETKPRPMAWYSGFHDPGFFFLWNPESKLHVEGIWNPVPEIRNPQRGVQHPRLSWIWLSYMGVHLLESIKGIRE